VHAEVLRLPERYPYWGYRKIFDLFDRDEFPVGRELASNPPSGRLAGEAETSNKRRSRRFEPVGVSGAEYPNHVSSQGFIHHQTIGASKLKCLTVVDEFTQGGLAIEVTFRLLGNQLHPDISG